MYRHHKSRRASIYSGAKYTYQYILRRFSQGDSVATTKQIATPEVWDAIERACAYMDVYFTRELIDTHDDTVPPSMQRAMKITFKEHNYAITTES